jgi:hypothetical protein
VGSWLGSPVNFCSTSLTARVGKETLEERARSAAQLCRRIETVKLARRVGVKFRSAKSAIMEQQQKVAVRAARVVPVIAGAALVFDMIGGFAMFAAAV